MSINKHNWEDYLVEFCAPTLAGIKCANLFGMAYSNDEELINEIVRLNRMCNDKGVNIKVLQHKNKRALIYVYREKMLKSILEKECIWELLCDCGYRKEDVDSVLNVLKKRIAISDVFPHEIGIFLGYPYCDVKGFIDNAGNDFIFCGHWKVYENEKQSRKLFHTFDTCRECYRNSYKKGMTVAQLLVAV